MQCVTGIMNRDFLYLFLMTSTAFMGIAGMLTTGFAVAVFVEDYSSFPSEDAIDDILEYCESNPNGDITTGLVDTEEISEFYTDYTCEQAAGEKEWLDNDRDPDANTASDDE
jgi:hypothetical protein